MRNMNIDREWTFRYALPSFYPNEKIKDEIVNLPHDYMIHSAVTREAPAGPAMGYYTAGVASYSRYIDIPEEWSGDRVSLVFDGIMMNATVEVNGGKVCLHHYGYTPFEADITDHVEFGGSNKVIITVNPSMQPNSRWYTGAGIIRSVELVHTGAVHVEHDGVFIRTRRIDYDNEGQPLTAHMSVDVNVCSHTDRDRLVRVEAVMRSHNCHEENAECLGHTLVQVPARGTAAAHINMRVSEPKLWSSDSPELYDIDVKLYVLATVGAHIEVAAEAGNLETGSSLEAGSSSETGSSPEAGGHTETAVYPAVDSCHVSTGIRTIFCDPARGLIINETTVKLKGGCIHHDNGIIGAISLYDSEYRKLMRLKKLGFNAVRIAHNPPSAVLLRVCDEIGMYVYDEAFDAWSMCKQPGDYNQFFEENWREDIKAFVSRDYNHPSVIIWSTGNEIMERGGNGGGYLLADKLAGYIKELDSTRPVSNAVCSFWLNPADDTLKNEYDRLQKINRELDMKLNMQSTDSKCICNDNDTDEQTCYGNKVNNVDEHMESPDLSWEYGTAAFVNSLDIVGYNYLDQLYELDSKVFPERVMVGTESFPNQFDTVWKHVMERPNVIGDFTWTCYDYLGEAGVGRAAYVEDGDPLIEKGSWGLMSDSAEYPWRLANDADFDILGNMLAQGAYRKVVWGSKETFVYSYSPEAYGLHEIVSGWGWPYVSRCWNWKGFEGRNTNVVIYTAAEEVELICNGRSLGRKACGEANRYTAVYSLEYEPGRLEAISYANGEEISRDELVTTGKPVGIRLMVDDVMSSQEPLLGQENEAAEMTADGHSLCYVWADIVDENGLVIPDAKVKLNVNVDSICSLAGFGSANPITEENYQAGSFTTYRGRALAVVRAGYKTGTAVLRVSSEEFSSELKLRIKGC